MLSTNTKYPAIVKYKPMFVRDNDRLPNIGASMLNKFLISNWSSGLIMFVKLFIKGGIMWLFNKIFIMILGKCKVW